MHKIKYIQFRHCFSTNFNKFLKMFQPTQNIVRTWTLFSYGLGVTLGIIKLAWRQGEIVNFVLKIFESSLKNSCINMKLVYVDIYFLKFRIHKKKIKIELMAFILYVESQMNCKQKCVK